MHYLLINDILQGIAKGLEFYYVFGEEAKLDVTVNGKFTVTAAVPHNLDFSRIEVPISLPEGNQPRVLFCYYRTSRSSCTSEYTEVEINSCWIRPEDGINGSPSLCLRTLRINICSGDGLPYDVDCMFHVM